MFNVSSVVLPTKVAVDGYFSQLGKPNTGQPNSLVYCESIYYLQQAVDNSQVSVIICTPNLFESHATAEGKGIILSEDPRNDYWDLHCQLATDDLLTLNIDSPGVGTDCLIHSSAVIGTNVQIGDRVSIGAGAVIEDGSVIGDDVRIAAGVVIGAEGLQTYTVNGRKKFIKHAGGVKIGRETVVLANAVVSKAIYPEFTNIGDFCLLSILSSVGHQSQLGGNCSLAGNVLIGGSVIMGDNVWVGPSATIKDGLRIGSNVQIKLGSVVIKDISEGEVVSGNFAISHRSNLRHNARKSR